MRTPIVVLSVVPLLLTIACGAPEPPPGETATFATTGEDEGSEKGSGGTMVEPVEGEVVVDDDDEDAGE
jgi:hypothetical protein